MIGQFRWSKTREREKLYDLDGEKFNQIHHYESMERIKRFCLSAWSLGNWPGILAKIDQGQRSGREREKQQGASSRREPKRKTMNNLKRQPGVWSVIDDSVCQSLQTGGMASVSARCVNDDARIWASSFFVRFSS